jgi:FkbM family methyltransferase
VGNRKKLLGVFVLTLLVFIALGFFLLPRPRYIFIDGGAHLGESIDHFVKSSLYPQHPWEMISIEANPYLIPSIPKRKNLTILNKAIWTGDEGVEFYLAEASESSSIIKDKITGNLSKTPIRVESIDFGKWLKDHFSTRDHILVKLDIEGAEYDVLKKMLRDGTIKYVDELYVEFHNVRVGVSEEEDRSILAQLEKLGIPVKTETDQKESGDWFD